MASLEEASAPAKAPERGTKKHSFGRGPESRYDLSFSDIVVSVASKELQLVKGVSGKVKSGSLLCVLGPSGCGKSTLLECLANLRRPNLRVTGSILFNQQKLSSSQRRQIVSFCSQDHSLLGEFTVEETLRCTARLYFGYQVSSSVIEEKVTRVMESVGLIESAKVRVGNLFFSGLSGGQKRRLAIGVELIVSPSVIILDEPTSGLDSSASMGIMKLMQDLAEQGHTLMASIHQPSSKIWSMMGDVGPRR
jgi:ABC-type multidrug transport system ATPase subunit